MTTAATITSVRATIETRLFLLLLASAVVACSGSNSTPSILGAHATHAIGGSVSGATASGVVIALGGAASASASAITDASGAFSFASLADGHYTLTASKAGFTFAPASASVTLAGADIGGQSFVATAIVAVVTPVPHAISGRVTGATGVTIAVSGAATASATADSSGAFSFPNLPDGNYTLTPSLSGFTFSPASLQVVLAGSDLSGVTFGATAVPPATHAISGVVSGDVSAGAQVWLSGAASATATTGLGGYYEFPDLPDGNYAVAASLSGYLFAPASVSVIVAGADIKAEPIVSRVVPAPTHMISGRLSGRAVAGIAITLSGAASRTTTTGPSGGFAFTFLPDGNYALTPGLPGFSFAPASREVALSGADSNDNDFTSALVDLNSGATFVLDPAPGLPSAEGNNRPAIAADAAGKVHLAFLSTGIAVNHLLYATCQANCQQGSQWTSIVVEAAGPEPQGTSLALDGNGHPRIHYAQDNGDGSMSLRYLECNSDSCASSSAWTGTTVLSEPGYLCRHGVYSLAIDAQGHPAFFFMDVPKPQTDSSIALALCTSADCTAGDWSMSDLPFQTVQKPNSNRVFLLEWWPGFRAAFDPAGGLHLVGKGYAFVEGSNRLASFSCAGSCDQLTNWRWDWDEGSGALGNQVVRVDASGTARVVFGPAPGMTYFIGPSSAHPAWAATSTNASSFALEDVNPGLDLDLDGQGRPRTAFTYADARSNWLGVGLTTCDANCDDARTWNVTRVESAQALPPLAPASGCGEGTWLSGGNVRLALLPDGHKIIAYENSHQAGGSCAPQTDKQLVRVAVQ